MRVIAKPKKEKKVLAAVKKNAKGKEIYKGMVTRAECCVDHLCGCTN
ncbi:MAG TPA: hypothetical protein PKD42_16935 [Chitinophagaceae bacterium]|jgi:hypothetical protein|nr:hypothetical protein [Chitinophagaceae bacterium]